MGDRVVGQAAGFEKTVNRACEGGIYYAQNEFDLHDLSIYAL